MDIYPFKICGSGYDIISEKSGYDPFLENCVIQTQFREKKTPYGETPLSGSKIANQSSQK